MHALSTAQGGKPAAPRFVLWSRPRRPAAQEALAGYLALLPWLISFFALAVFPLAVSTYRSFTQSNLLKPPQSIDSVHAVGI